VSDFFDEVVLPFLAIVVGLALAVPGVLLLMKYMVWCARMLGMLN
jgi:hypothetical protein